MNLGHVQFELAETLLHLQELLAEFREGRMESDDTPKLAVELGHILDHISYVWNSRDLSPEALLTMPEAEYERLANTVPNFQATRVMGDTACC
jgi:hypothetical protein